MAKWAIVGAGLAGMTLAQKLTPKHDVTVFEKSHGSAGRMSTRRRSDDGVDYAFDHGAQYFTIKGEGFSAAMRPYLDQGIIAPWQPRMVDISRDGHVSDRDPHAPIYVASPGMTALAKAMGEGVDLHHQVEITSLKKTKGLWQLTASNGDVYDGFDGVVTAIPAPQAAVLIPESAADLAHVKMLGCLTVMLGFQDHAHLPQDWDAAFVQDAPLGFIAVNSTKPGRGTAASLVVQANNEWANPKLDEDPKDLEAILHQEIETLIGVKPSMANLTSFHRWRYAATRTPLGQDFWQNQDGDLAIIGDWCIKGRVEAAYDSAAALAASILAS